MNEMVSSSGWGRDTSRVQGFIRGGHAVLALLLVSLLLLPGLAAAQLAERYVDNATGDIAMVGNGLLTCPGNCDRSGNDNNTNVDMVFINVDPVGGSAPANSSTADLDLPADADVKFAGLYWAGRSSSTNADRNDIWIKAPGGSYQMVSALAADLHTFTTVSNTAAATRPYTAFTDVTGIVAAAGKGTYAVGGLTANTGDGGSLGNYGGWALIVAYESDTKPFRHLVVWDGDGGYLGNGNTVSNDVTGLLTPPVGDYAAFMGALVWEGDAGITGDRFQLIDPASSTGGVNVAFPGDLSDAVSPANNFWNSRIAHLGTLFTDRNPAYTNNYAIDLKLVDVSNNAANRALNLPYLLNDAEDVRLQFTTDQDAYFPHAAVFIVDLYRPEVIPTLEKTAVKVGGSPGPDLHPGDTVEYTISFHNQGLDGATIMHAFDPIPAGLTYVPNSIWILQDDGDPSHAGPQSDALDADFAEFDASEGARGTLHFRVGDGATGGTASPARGGVLLPDDAVVLRYRAVIDSDFTGDTITNVVTINHGSLTFPDDPTQDVTGTADTPVTVSPFPPLLLAKSASPDAVASAVGETVEFTLVVHTYEATASNLEVTDSLPAGWAYVPGTTTITYPGGGVTGAAADPAGGTGPTLTWNQIPNLADDAEAVIRFTAITTAAPTGDSINHAEVDGEDAIGGALHAEDDATVGVSDLAIVKQADVTEADPGDTVTYTVTITNNGTARQTGIRIDDPLAPDTSYVPQSTVATGFVKQDEGYLDNFSSIAFNGSNGTINWSGSPWVKTDSSTSTTNGSIRVSSSSNCPDGNCLRIRPQNTSRYVYRQADLTTASCAAADAIEVSFDYNNALDTASGSRAVAAYLYTGGTQRAPLALFNRQNPGTGSVSYTLSGQEIAANTRLRFNITGTGGDSSSRFVYIDNVRFACRGGGTVAATRDNIPGGSISDLVSGVPSTLVRAGDEFVLEPSASMIVTYQATVDAGAAGVLTNTATMSSDQQQDPIGNSANVEVLNPELAIVKTGPLQAFVGEAFDYVITVSNAGTADARAPAVISDSVPAGLLINSVTPVPSSVTCSTSGQDVTCTVPAGDLEIGETVTITVNVTPDASINGNTVTNTGAVAGGGDPACTAANPCESDVDTDIRSPGLALTKTGSYDAGTGVITYTFVVENTGNVDLVNVNVNDTLLGSLSCTAVNLPVGGAPQTLVCTANTYVPDSTDHAAGGVDNTASATGTDPSGGTVTATDSEHTPLPSTLVTYAKTSNPASGTAVNAGSLITYTLTVEVANSALTSDLVLTDTLSGDQTFGAVTSAGAFTPDVNNAPVLEFTLPSGTTPGTYSLSYTATVDNDATGTVGNVVTGSGGTPPGGTPPGCDANASCSTTHPLTDPAVTYAKTSNPASGTAVDAGDTITYTLTVDVTNSALVSDLVLTDTLSGDQTFGSVTSAGAFTPDVSNAPVLEFTLPSGTAPGTYALTYTTTVDADASGTIGNVVSAAGGTPPTTPPGCDPAGSCSTTHPLTDPAVTYAKTSNPASGTAVDAGDTITYTLTVDVTNSALTSDLVLTDTLSGDQTFGSVTSAGAFTPNVSNAPVLEFTLPAGTAPGTYALSYTATVDDDAAGTVGNVLIADGGTPPGGTPPGCDTSTGCETTHPLTDPAVTYAKSSDPTSGTAVDAGDTITYTLTVDITNSALVSDLVLTDTLSGDQTFDAVTSAGDFTADTSNAPTLLFTLPAGTAPGTYALSYTATVDDDATGTVGNVVIADGGTPPGGTPPGCDTSTSCETTHPLTDPAVTYAKSSNPASGTAVDAGDTITYTLTVDVTNSALTSDLVLTDTLSGDQTFGSVTSAGAFTPDVSNAPVLLFTLPSGTAPGTYALTYTATVDDDATGTVGNVVTADGGTPPGSTPPACDANASCETTHPLTDPAVTYAKSSDPTSGTAVDAGDTITYTLTVDITNSALVSDLVLTDTLSGDQTFGSVTSAGAFTPDVSNAPVLEFTLPSGTAPGTYSLSYTATVDNDATGTVGNVVTGSGGTPPGGTPPGCDANASCSTTHPLTDPAVTYAKTSNPASGTAVDAGDTITYTLTVDVTNSALVSDLVLTDTLSGDQIFGSVTSAGAFTANVSNAPVLEFTLPSGTAPGTYALSYTATVDDDATGTVGNVVIADGGTPPGGTPPGCDTSTGCETTHPLTDPAVTYAKSSNPASGTAVDAGDTITYTLTVDVTNSALVSDLVLTDTLSGDQTFGAVTSAGAFTPDVSNPPTLLFTLPSGTAPGTYALSYTATVDDNATGTVGNVLIADGGTPPGGTPPGCDTSTGCETTHPLTDPAVTYAKSSNPASGTAVDAGDTITYTLTVDVTNSALTSDLVLTDTLSGDQTFGSVTSAGAFTPDVSNAPALEFTLPSGTAPGTYVLSYTATVDDDATGTVGNVVTADGGTPPGSPPPACDANASCETTHPLTDPAVTYAKSSDPASGTAVDAGDTITYTLTVDVTNSALTSDLVLTDTLSGDQTFGSVTSAGAFTPNVSAAPVLEFTLPAGTAPGTYALSYTATVDDDATGTVGNVVTADGGTPPGSTPPACDANASCETDHPLTDPAVTYAKSSDPTSGTAIDAGDTITYTLTVDVTNSALVSDLVLTDTLSGDQTFGSVTSAGAFTPNVSAAPVLEFTLPSGTAPGTYALSYTATVDDDATGTVGNVVIADGGTPPGSTPPGCDTSTGCETTHPLTDPAVTYAKSSDPASGTAVDAGDTITYTLTVDVTNSALVSDLVLTDTLSGDQTFGSVTSAGAFTPDVSNPPTLLFTLPSGTAPGTYALSYTATVDDDATGTVGNVLIADGGTPPGSTPPACDANASCETTHPLTDPAVTYAKSSNPASGTAVDAGDTITYTLTVDVTNSALTSDLVLTDTLSGDQTFDAVTSAGDFTADTSNAPTLLFTLPSGTAPGTYALSYTATVDDDATGTVGNVVTADGGTPPGSTPPACDANASCETTHPLTDPAVTYAKSSNPASGTAVDAGDTITYTLTVDVTNSALVSDLVLTDTLSGDQTFDAVTSAGDFTADTSNAPTLLFTLPAGTAPGTYALSYTATVDDDATGTVGNVVTADGGTPPGSTPPACDANASCETDHPLTDPAVTYAKSSDPASGTAVDAGDTITYTLTVDVTNSALVSDLVLTDTLSGDQTFDAVTSAGDFTADTSNAPTLLFTLPAGTAPGTYALSYTATVDDDATGTVGNVVTADGGTPPGSTPPACDANASCETDHPLTDPAVTYAKSSDPASGTAVDAGDTITYTLTVDVTNSALTSDLVLTDTLSGDQTFDAVTSAGDFTADTSNAPTLLFTLPAGTAPGTCALTYTATVDDDATGTVGNVVTADGGTPPGSTPPACDANASCETDHPLTDPAVTYAKSSDPASGTAVDAGDTITYTLTVDVTNSALVSDLVLTDTLSGDQTFDAVTSAGDFTADTSNAPTLLFTLPAGTAPGTYALSYTATVDDDATGTVGNVVAADGGTPPTDPPGCETADGCETEHPLVADLTLSKELTSEDGALDGVAEPGETLVYAITLSNSGGEDATGVDITDPLDANVSFVSADNGGTESGGSVTWTGLTVPAGADLVLTVTVEVVDPLPANVTSIVNLAHETGETPPDCDVTPVPDACVILPTVADLTLFKDLVDEDGTRDGIAEPGEIITYEITLRNNGGAPATGIDITDPLDPFTSFISADNGGLESGGVVTWTGLTVNPGVDLVLTVVVQVDDPIPDGVAEIVNLAYQTGDVPPDCEASPTPAACVITPTEPSISVTKAVSGESIDADGIAEPGEEITYTITVRNDGGTATTDTLVNEIVPANTSFVGGTPAWSCVAGDPGGTACDALVSVPAHDGTDPGTATLTFIVRVDDPLADDVTTVANGVTLDDGPPPDCISLPTSPGCAVMPTVNLRLTKTVDTVLLTGPAQYRVDYSISVTNTGGAPASYTLTDTPHFTAGVIFLGNARVTTTGGSVNPALPGGEFPPANGATEQISASNVSINAGTTHEYVVSLSVGVQPGSLADPLCDDTPGHGLYNAAAITGSLDLESAACAPANGDIALIHLEKTVRLAVDVNGNQFGDPGDVLGYTFVISNPGAVPLSTVQLFDPRAQALVCEPLTHGGQPFRVRLDDEIFRSGFDGHFIGGTLDPGDAVTCTGEHVLTAADVARGRVVNSATATGAAPGGQAVSSVATAIFTQFN